MKLSRRNFVIGSIAVSAPVTLPNFAYGSNFDEDLELIITKSLERMKTEAETTSDWIYIFEEEVVSYMKNVWKNHKPLIQYTAEDKFGIPRPINLWSDPNFYQSYNTGGQIRVNGQDDVTINLSGFVTCFDHPYLDHVKVICDYQDQANKINVEFKSKEDV
jgi:hypothetical protein